MGTKASQITSFAIVYSTVYSGADQRKHHSSASLAFVPGTGEFPAQMASNVKLWCFLWSVPEQTNEQTIETPVIWDAIALIMTSF